MNYKLVDLIALLGCEVKGDLSLENISGLAPFFQAQEDSLTFASDEKFLKKLHETRAKVIIVPDIPLPENIGKTYLKVKENPRTLMPKLLNFFIGINHDIFIANLFDKLQVICQIALVLSATHVLCIAAL